MIKSRSKLLTIALSCCLFQPSANAMNLKLSIDRYFSPYVGADLMISALKVYETADDMWLASSTGDTSGWMVLGRMAKFSAEYTLSNWAMVAQHEVFGHGARAREFHLGNIGYDINLFSGSTYFSRNGFSELNVLQQSALAAGGMEATSILANQLQNDWIRNSTIDHRDATLFLTNYLDQSMYVWGTKKNNFRPDNDVVSYINRVNAWHGNTILNLTNLKRKIAWDWLNPMLYMSFLSLYDYWFDGDTSRDFSQLSFKDFSFMPTTRTLLTPWGPEFQLQNHFVSMEDKYIGVYLRTGRTGGKMSHGLDIKVQPLAEYDGWALNNTVSVWHQPHILKSLNAAKTTAKYGFAEIIGLDYKMNNAFSTVAELGYKTSGYLPGYPLARGLIWRINVKLNLDATKKSC